MEALGAIVGALVIAYIITQVLQKKKAKRELDRTSPVKGGTRKNRRER